MRQCPIRPISRDCPFSGENKETDLDGDVVVLPEDAPVTNPSNLMRLSLWRRKTDLDGYRYVVILPEDAPVANPSNLMRPSV